MQSTDTNFCSLPLMCVCTIETLSLSQKPRRQAGYIILKEVMTWVSRGEKPGRQLLRGRPADVQAYRNIWEMLKIRDGVLYRTPLEGGAEHLGKLRWCVPTNSTEQSSLPSGQLKDRMWQTSVRPALYAEVRQARQNHTNNLGTNRCFNQGRMKYYIATWLVRSTKQKM